MYFHELHQLLQLQLTVLQKKLGKLTISDTKLHTHIPNQIRSDQIRYAYASNLGNGTMPDPSLRRDMGRLGFLGFSWAMVFEILDSQTAFRHNSLDFFLFFSYDLVVF